MPALRTCAVAMLCAAITLSYACAATRIYLMRGIHFGPLFFSDGMDQIGARLHGPDRTIGVGDWTDRVQFERDAFAHKADQIIVGGHSMGAWAACVMARNLKARGYSVRVVGLDPLLTGADCAGVPAVCFWQGGYPMRGAHNVFVASSYGHVGYASDPRVQARFIAAVGL